MNHAAIVLAGGRSRRMGRTKWSLPFGEGTLLDRVVARVQPAVDEVIVVARDGQDVAAEGVRLARDDAEGLGPLAGLVAGLRATEARHAFLVSCDVPLLRTALVRRLFELAAGRPLAVPVIDGFHMSTTAVYGREVLPVAEELLAARRLRPFFLLEAFDAREVTADELRDVDPDLESFRNCNTMDDYEAALRDAGCA